MGRRTGVSSEGSRHRARLPRDRTKEWRKWENRREVMKEERAEERKNGGVGEGRER